MSTDYSTDPQRTTPRTRPQSPVPTPAPPAPHDTRRDTPRRRAVLIAATLLGMALTARLGVWQLDRAAQKLHHQAELDARIQLPALTTADLAHSLTEAEAQLQRRILVQGRWIERATLYLDNRPMDGQAGFYVITPLQLADGTAVLVQRGWVPRHPQHREQLPPIQTPDTPLQVEARIIPTPSRLYDLGGFETGPIRQNIDLDAASRELGLSLRPVTLLQTAPADTGQPDSQGLRRHWSPPATGVDKHYGYAAQWFGLSALIAGLFVWFQWIQPRRLRRTTAPAPTTAASSTPPTPAKPPPNP